MINLKPLLIFLKVVSLLGLIVTTSMMIAVIYKKLKEYYPQLVESHKWVFILMAILMAIIMVFLYQKFIAGY